MKTWAIAAVLAATAMTAAAQQAAVVDEKSRGELVLEIGAFRDTVFPPEAEPTDLSRECVADLNKKKDLALAAKTPLELTAARKSYADTKATVLNRLYRARSGGAGVPETRTQFDARLAAQANMLMTVRQQFASSKTRSVLDATGEAARGGALGNFYDGSGGSANALDAFLKKSGRTLVPTPMLGASDGAVRASTVAGAERYDRVRSELLSSYRGELQAKYPRNPKKVDGLVAERAKIIDTAIAEGLRQKVDPMLVLGVIWKESTFHRTALNDSSGAAGLMQLMPGTAAQMGAGGSKVYDIKANIAAGVKYIKWIANDFFKMNANLADVTAIPQKTLKTILASYNWGIGNVQKALNRNGLTRLPAETRDYITKITGQVTSWLGWP